MFRNTVVFTISIVVSSIVVPLLPAEAGVRFLVNPVDFLAVTTETDPVLNHRIAPGAAGHGGGRKGGS